MKKFKICLDAGHIGKYNQSPANKKYYESDMNWKLHLLLKEEFEKYENIEVITTRKTQEENKGLSDRGKKSKGCNLFLSIHSNAVVGNVVNNKADYPVVIYGYGGDNEVKDFALKLSQVIEKTMITKQKGRCITKKSNVAERDYYGVLRGAALVGVKHRYIVEHSFHTNLEMTNWLLNDDNLRLMAKREVELILDYFKLEEKEKSEEQLEEQPEEKPKKENINIDVDTYIVRIKANALNIRKGPGTNYNVVGVIRDKGAYTIIETKGNWGRLKSGAGWISVNPAYCTKIK